VTPPAGTVYVYGILSAADQAAVHARGVEGSLVRTVEHAGLAALVSDLQAESLAAAREVRSHWRVLEEASKDATVLPVRFGTVLEGDDAVREQLLEPHAERLVTLLGELGGRVQLTVKGQYDEERQLIDVVATSPAIAALRERVRALPGEAGYYERIRLGELVAAEVARRREHDAQRVLDRLQPLAVAARAEAPKGPDGAFDLAFLVERSAIDAFSMGVVSVGDELGERVRIRYVGPVPPYSFADAELTVGSAEWA
jgi:hypothetical protein